MSPKIKIHFAYEDELSLHVAIKLVAFSKKFKHDPRESLYFTKGGNGYIKKNLIEKFVSFCSKEYLLILTDLDRGKCAPKLISDWFKNTPIPKNMVFRIAVHEIESWVLADRTAIEKYFGKSFSESVPLNTDQIQDPKQFIMNHSNKMTDPSIIKDLVSKAKNNSLRQGLNYNSRMIHFVDQYWDAKRARVNSPSLARALERLDIQ